MMTSSNGNIWRVTGPLCGEFTGHRWIPRTKASGAELWCFLLSLLCLNKRLRKQWRGWWFETPSSHYDVIVMPYPMGLSSYTQMYFTCWFESYLLNPRVQLTINQHWFGWWVGVEQATDLDNWCPVNSPNKGQWRGALVFSFISALPEQTIAQTMARLMIWDAIEPLWRHCNALPNGIEFIHTNVFHMLIRIVFTKPKGSINNKPALVRMMGWRRTGDRSGQLMPSWIDT